MTTKRKFYAYIRVSTKKQEEKGVSIKEQRDAIESYSQRQNLEIVRWFQDVQSAAKRGRREFTQMLKGLKRGHAVGLIIHKIDRSARNFLDWGYLGELADNGVEIHAAHDNLNLNTRGGRLFADMQMVIAADFIRNNREEVKKGIKGRLKEGLYPRSAPLGYLDMGKGKRKEIDPVKGPLIKQAFQLYATGAYSLKELVEELEKQKLTNKRGGRISINGLSTILNCPFYTGIIHVKRTGEIYIGKHEALISKALFDRVKEILRLKTTHGDEWKHDFTFRQTIKCASCKRSISGEPHKGRVYYRCNKPYCPTTCIREDRIEEAVEQELKPLEFGDIERTSVGGLMNKLTQDWQKRKDAQISAITFELTKINERLGRLTDDRLDRVINQDIFGQKQAELVSKKKDIEDKLTKVKTQRQGEPEELRNLVVFAGSVYGVYKSALPAEKRELLRIVSPNRELDRKKLVFMPHLAFGEIKKRNAVQLGADDRESIRITWERLLPKLVRILAVHPIEFPQWVLARIHDENRNRFLARESA